MRKFTFAILALLSLAVAAWAGEPWKQKAYKEWDDVDLKRILFDSPWARKVTIPFEMGAKMGSQPSAAIRSGGGSSSASQGPGSSTGGESDVPDVRGGGMNFTIQWASSLTMRRAIARISVHQGAMTEVDAENSLSGEVADYGIAVLGPNMDDFQKLDEAGLQKVTSLRPKKAKEKLAPTKVEIQRGADGKTVTAVLFHFPKKMTNGEPVVEPDEKSVEFVCKPGTLYIRTAFEPQKMNAQEGNDW